ncbi:MAG: chloride channel protein [Kofleriaceae bacterium]
MRRAIWRRITSLETERPRWRLSSLSPTHKQRLFGLTVLIGGVCGLVAVAFHVGIRTFERLTIERAFEQPEDLWIPWVVAVPALGALAAGIALYYIPGARGSGVPQVKVAYTHNAMGLKLRDTVGKFLIGIVQIGSGSSLGREGPTVQICSGVAKLMGSVVGLSPHHLKLLIPVGSAAGIAAAFNAPIAAVTFTIEEIVGRLDDTLLSGVIVAAALAAVVERAMLGESPVFTIPQGYGLDHASSLLVYAALGVAAAIVSVVFAGSLLTLRRRFNASQQLPLWLRPAIGGVVTGVIAVAAMLIVQTGGVTGGGYETLLAGLSGDLGLEAVLVLGACKLVATVFAYASGGAGGIFAPSLFIGAMLGAAFGALDIAIFGHPHAEIGSFALVGMGAVFAGTVRAPITSVLIIIEMTAGYGLTLPLMIANMMAYGLARHLRPTPIYEALLEQDGISLTFKRRTVDPIDGLTIASIPSLSEGHLSFRPGDTVRDVLEAVAKAGRQEVFPVLAIDRRVVGMIVLEDLATLSSDSELESLVRAADFMRPPRCLEVHELASRAWELMMTLGIRQLPIVDSQHQFIALIDETVVAREFLRIRTAERGS